MVYLSIIYFDGVVGSVYMNNHCVLVAAPGSHAFAYELSTLLKIPLLHVADYSFSDGELFLDFCSDLSGCDVVVVQNFSHCSHRQMLAMFLLLDTIFCANPNRVCLVIPYLPYARSDRPFLRHGCVSIRALARLLNSFRFSHVYTLDIHSNLAAGYFDGRLHSVRVDSLWHASLRSRDVAYVFSPDQGGFFRARGLASRLGVRAYPCTKIRMSDRVAIDPVGLTSFSYGRAVVVDDVIVTGQTLLACVSYLLQQGLSVDVCVTHCLATPEKLSGLKKVGVEKFLVTNTVVRAQLPMGVETVSAAPLIATKLQHQGYVS